MKIKIQDPYGRTFPYLRLSITEVCNFRCQYCLPNGYQKPCEVKSFLNIDEMRRLVRGFAGLGVQKIRLTGGEPTVRKDLPEIARIIASQPEIKALAMTTNGYKLHQQAQEFFAAGIRRINVSIDSLNAHTFKEITGHDRLHHVLGGVEKCLDLGFERVKVNTVLLKKSNLHELDSFFAFVKDKPVEWRFIELMQTGDNHAYFQAEHVRSGKLEERLLQQGWRQEHRAHDAGPALTFSHPDYVGKIGLIQPYRSDFCDSCNRLRVSAYGELQLCLFGEGRYDLRPLLQSDEQIPELQSLVAELLRIKPPQHYLHQANIGRTQHLASIGG